jgi:hypothetical protein
MVLDEWIEVDATTWKDVVGHVVGKREKRWIVDEGGQVWLEKFPKSWRPSELAIEVFASALARALGIEAASCHAAIDGPRRALVSRRFLDEGEQLLHGDQLLEEVVNGYDPDNRAAHTLGAVRAAIGQRLDRLGLAKFAAVLALDAWIGHGDRHPQNWGIVVLPGLSRLAPVYDTAACLGAELTDQGAYRLINSGSELRRYALACPSGFGNGIALVSMLDVSTELRSWPEWKETLAAYLPRFRSVLAPAQSYLRRIPHDWLSAAHGEVACELLAHRLEWMEDLVP